MVLHVGSSEGWVENCLFLLAKNIGDTKVDNHDDMNASLLKHWFTHSLIPNLIIVSDSEACIQKRNIIDIALSYGHEVLRLPSYQCFLSPIELVWIKLKSEMETTPFLSASVCQHLREYAADIDAELWKKNVLNTLKKLKANTYFTIRNLMIPDLSLV
ncbi:hypothetical protein ANN_04997 [Periplaneta americana]|uniref:Tc1-like transposase DDE domain-containing protein n=1 Tax=Periplaneta americana TaxID=6978 RepID=A0ABQ8TBJ4_PERAM|nr:hypothetical protein ANN_04997 [Periplaneta americana]